MSGAGEIFSEGTSYCAVFCNDADSKQKFGNNEYGAGTAFRFSSGRCMVVCQRAGGLYYEEITPEEYDDLESGKTQVYNVSIRNK